MIIKRFNNGNFNVKHEADYDYSNDLIEQLCNSSELDFVPAGDEGSFGNWDVYYPLYNAYTDMIYLPTGSDCNKYRQGKAVKLRGRVMDAYERQELNDIIGGLER